MQRFGVSVCVGQAVDCVTAVPQLDLVCAAFEIVIMTATRHLAGTDTGNALPLGMVTVVEERVAIGVLACADGDGAGMACGVAVVGTLGGGAAADFGHIGGDDHGANLVGLLSEEPNPALSLGQYR